MIISDSESKAMKGHNIPAMGAAHLKSIKANRALNGRNDFGCGR